MDDIRLALRTLRKNPGFALVAVLAMGIGIGVNTTIFGVFNQMLLRPLPFADPDRLVFVWESFPRFGLERNTPAVGNFAEWRAQNHVFADMAAYVGPPFRGSFTWTGGKQPERVQGALVTAHLFSVLGVEPLVGRTFLESEDREGGPHVVVVGHRLWQQSFGGDRNVIGRPMILDGKSYTVIGVMPAGFSFPSRDTELWAPLALTSAQLANRGSHYLQVIARLKGGVSVERASAEMKTIAHNLAAQHPDTNSLVGSVVVPMKEQIVGDVKSALVVLLAAVGLVLLISCANVANLLLARSLSRQKEMAVRAALGAGAWRLARQALAESVVLAASGGLLGLLLAYWGVAALVSLAPRALLLGSGLTATTITGRIDGGVLAFTALLSIGTGLLFGAVPAFTALRAPIVNLRERSRGTGGKQHGLLRSALVISELALALTLLIGAGLLLRSFARLAGVSPGFDPRNVLAVKLTLPTAKYPRDEDRYAAYREILRRVESVPSVKSAGMISALPMTVKGGSTGFYVEGTPIPGPGQLQLANNRVISPGYLHTMSIPLKAGRDFDRRDTAGAPPVALVNETMAGRYFPQGQALGKRFKLGLPGDSSAPWITVVGIVGDVRQYALDTQPNPETIFPYEQGISAFTPRDLVVRTAGNPKALAATIRKEIRAFDPGEPVDPVQTMEEIVGQTIVLQRLEMVLLAAFSLVALALASMGVYGVLSYLVAQRTNEIGIRMALGATPVKVLRLVVGQGLTLGITGIAVGLGGALVLARLLSGLLYGVKPTDGLTFAAVPLVLAVAVLLASYIPARRATRLDPVAALRSE
jgi:putative ABC transport system permease protein